MSSVIKNSDEHMEYVDDLVRGSWVNAIPANTLANINKFIGLFVQPAMIQARAMCYEPGKAYLALSYARENWTYTIYRDLVLSSTFDITLILEYWAINKAKGYVNLGYRSTDLGSGKRGSYEHVIGIPGFWTDIDIAGPGHKEKNLPRTLEEAKSLIAEAMPDYLPTHIVHSGGGLHGYWLFRTPWFFKDEEEKKLAQLMLRGLHARLLAAAQKHGWKIDNVSDLARLLRVPGSYNMKDPATPKLVEISAWN